MDEKKKDFWTRAKKVVLAIVIGIITIAVAIFLGGTQQS